MSVLSSIQLVSNRRQTDTLPVIMGITVQLAVCAMWVAAIVITANAQVRPTPRLSISMNPNRNGFPGFPATNFFKNYCPLDFVPSFKDTAILETSPVELAAARAAAQSRLSDNQRIYLSGRRALSAARDARRARDGRGPGGNSTSGGSNGRPTSRGRSPGRSRRNAGDVAVLAPTTKKSICTSTEKVVQSVLHNGQVCYLFSEDEIHYWECGGNFASVSNTQIRMQRYYCEADNYVFQSAMAFCPDINDVDFITVNVPISCCAVRRSCDFTPYSSLNGPKFFTAERTEQ